MAKNAHANSLQ